MSLSRFIAACLFSLALTVVHAAPPSTLGYQGRLTLNGAPLNAAVVVTFSLYAAPSGGSPLWSESQSITPVNGLYSAVLGQVSAFPAGLFTQPLWIGVAIAGNAEMTPRQPLSSVPYAQQARSASVATALAAPPTACPAGQFAQGVDAAGNAVGCAAPVAAAGTPCDAGHAGQLRWTGSRFEGCDGSAWTPFALPSCSDGVKNGNETDVDCGGSCPGQCAAGGACTANADCATAYCNPQHVCALPSCTDGIKNGDETDVDCGGSCGKCQASKACQTGPDCDSSVCLLGICALPSCWDGLQNGNETDKDCGGGSSSGCQACANALHCQVGGDCVSGICSNQVCAAP